MKKLIYVPLIILGLIGIFLVYYSLFSKTQIMQGYCKNYFSVYSCRYEQFFGTWSYNKIEDADVATFQPFGRFARDKNSIYFGGVKTIVNRNTFREINNEFSKDKNHVYVSASAGTDYFILSGADPDSFVAIGDGGFGKDRNHVFYGGIIKPVIDGADPSTFKVCDFVLSGFHLEAAKDKNTSYYHNWMLPNKTNEYFTTPPKEYSDKFNCEAKGLNTEYK